MPKTIPRKDFVNLKDRRVLAEELKESVELCAQKGRYVTVLCIIVCGIDALAGGDKTVAAHRRDYRLILEKHFPALCEKLGARKFYDRYRNGMVHHFHPMAGYLLGEDHELDGQYVAALEIEGRPGTRTAINIERLAKDFLRLCDHVIAGNPIP